jgi:hypothetical protein
MLAHIKRMTVRNALAFVALFVCVGGTATAGTKLIDGNDIKPGTVGECSRARLARLRGAVPV